MTDAPEPNAAEPSTTESNAAESNTTEPDAAESNASEPTATPATPKSGAPTPKSGAPTPATVNKDVPAEQWKRDLAAAAEAPAADRHTALSTLLDDLDSQVGSL